MSEPMDLKTFVQTTLVQIVEGVEGAISQIARSGKNAKINPFPAHGNHSDAKDVDFDVAVTVTDSKSGSGGAGIRIASFQIGGQGEVTVQSHAVSRIKFAVPVAIPGTATEQWKPLDRPRRTESDYDPFNSN
jgi:hypothetical protein